MGYPAMEMSTWLAAHKPKKPGMVPRTGRIRMRKSGRTANSSTEPEAC